MLWGKGLHRSVLILLGLCRPIPSSLLLFNVKRLRDPTIVLALFRIVFGLAGRKNEPTYFLLSHWRRTWSTWGSKGDRCLWVLPLAWRIGVNACQIILVAHHIFRLKCRNAFTIRFKSRSLLGRFPSSPIPFSIEKVRVFYLMDSHQWIY